MKNKKIVEKIGSPRYDRWLHEVVLDFGDYHFTREELNDMGIGMHCVAAKRLNRILEKGDTVHRIYKMGMHGIRRYKGIGETSLIVIAFCIAAARESYDVLKWMGSGRTIQGGVRANAKRRKSA
jgi:hypothetical protein